MLAAVLCTSSYIDLHCAIAIADAVKKQGLVGVEGRAGEEAKVALRSIGIGK